MSPPPKKPAAKTRPQRTAKVSDRRREGVSSVQATSKPRKSKRSVAETKPKVKSPKPAGTSQRFKKGDRIAKVMARRGLCSRREAERWIEDGRVRINGKRLTTPAYDVTPRDRIEVDGQSLPAQEPVRLWRYHKPRGLVTTHRDPQGRKTVFDALPDALPRVISVGRLDYNTEGLLLLTNDGDLARYLELPSTGWVRRYRVRAHGRVTDDQLKSLSEGLTVDGITYGPIEAVRDVQQGSNQWLTLGLREGKNREVRRVLAALGLEVNRLIRISYGPFQLLDLKSGQTDLVRRKTLVEQMGPKLSEQFHLTGDDVEGDSPQRPMKQRTGGGGQRRGSRTPSRNQQRGRDVKEGQGTSNPKSKLKPTRKRRPQKRRVK